MTVKFAMDTSCLVPLLSSWHEFHLRTKQAYELRHARHERPVIPVHALLETYSVLTRMPVCLAPGDAWSILEENFKSAEVPGLTGGMAWSVVQELGGRNTGGGIIYNAVIARTAFEAGASELLTWNIRDFLRVAPAGLDVREP